MYTSYEWAPEFQVATPRPKAEAPLLPTDGACDDNRGGRTPRECNWVGIGQTGEQGQHGTNCCGSHNYESRKWDMETLSFH